MELRSKRRVLAALEGQLYRWAVAREPARSRKRVAVLLRRLQQQPRDARDRPYAQRVASQVAELLRQRPRAELLRAYLTLLRVDCMLWQVALASSPRARNSSAASAAKTRTRRSSVLKRGA